VQEAILAAGLSLDRLVQPDRFGSWLSGIALNKARQTLKSSMAEVRRATALGHGHELGPLPEEYAEIAEISSRVRAAVQALSPRQRDATYLFYLAGLTHREAAAELGVSVSAVKARLHQARANLSRSLMDLRPKGKAMSSNGDFIDVRIADVRASSPDTTPRLGLVLLKTPESDRHLPIFVGLQEAAALALSLENVNMPRPMTYQFAASLLEACNGRVTEVRIDKLVEITYFATVVVQTPSGQHETDARPSDALNLAVLTEARDHGTSLVAARTRRHGLVERPSGSDRDRSRGSRASEGGNGRIRSDGPREVTPGPSVDTGPVCRIYPIVAANTDRVLHFPRSGRGRAIRQ